MHHAYVYEGPLAHLRALAADARERFSFKEIHSPDVHVREFLNFGIGESRWLAGTAALKSASGRALFIIGVSSITSEAQQALLKLFEEPQQGTVFVLLIPYGVLLPTLRSRTLEYPARTLKTDIRKSDFRKDAKSFIASSHKERSEFVARLLKDDEGIKERVREFVNELEQELAVRLTKSNSAEVREGLEDIARVRDYLRDRSPSLKMLLEHLALALPRFDLKP